MSGVILALLEHPASAPHTLTASRNLAALFPAARINVLAIRVPPETTIMPTEEVLTPHHAAKVRAHEQHRVDALRAAFTAWEPTARTTDIAIEWIDIEGLTEALVAEWGRRADTIVIERPTHHASAPDRLAVHAALFDTDRPVLVVPPGLAAPIGQRVAIAWRDDKRTKRAVLASLQLLSSICQVHVLAGARAGAPSPALPKTLAEHGIDAKLHVLPIGDGVFGEALLSMAHAVAADMLVMGAYTHSTWRDLILGGVTRYMLAHADLPVLMRH
jgi:nucleotide-binding universal stress UspA family protein